MKKIIIAFTLILLIAVVPCLIEGMRSGDYSLHPGLIALLFLAPAAIIYLLVAETKINPWIIRSLLGIYTIFPTIVGLKAMNAELHGPLVGYWILPATIIFMPIILILPCTTYYKR